METDAIDMEQLAAFLSQYISSVIGWLQGGEIYDISSDGSENSNNKSPAVPSHCKNSF